MSEGTPDIAKIVSMIMENPKLIEEISNMARGKELIEAAPEAPTEEKEKEKAEEVEAVSARPSIPYGKNRSQLLCALKPYVSKERAHAIDSMISVVEILDMMKGR